MPDLLDGQSVEIKGSAAKPYVLKNVGGVYSCSCPAWRNQSRPIDRRTCKHLRQYRGDQAEQARLGGTLSPLNQPPKSKSVPPLLLAHAWDNEQDLTGWWLSEKLDGVRAYWNACIGYLFHYSVTTTIASPRCGEPTDDLANGHVSLFHGVISLTHIGPAIFVWPRLNWHWKF